MKSVSKASGASRKGGTPRLQKWHDQRHPKFETSMPRRPSVIGDTKCAVCISEDRGRWYAGAARRQKVYDDAGLPSYEQADFVRFTQEIQDLLLDIARQQGWRVIRNHSQKSIDELVEEVLAVVASAQSA